jgi:hypothetical protein
VQAPLARDGDAQRPAQPRIDTPSFINISRRAIEAPQVTPDEQREPVSSRRAAPDGVLRPPTRVVIADERETIAESRTEPIMQRVTVAIGRIEVTAARPPEPVLPVRQPPPAQPKPQLSLGEYLERSRRRRP